MDYTAMVIDTACGRAPDLTSRRRPCRAEVRFVFSAADLEALHRTDPGTIWRSSVREDTLNEAVNDSSGRHGWWITARTI